MLSDVQASHGQLLDLSKYVLALRWAALDADNHTVLAGLQANQAQNVAELQQAFRHYHSPMQSIVMADVDGAIAFQAAGKVPVRHADNDLRGVAPAPGWEARYDWQGWLDHDQTPQDSGAQQGWIATANQRITAPGYAHFLTQDWHLPYRYVRKDASCTITSLIGGYPPPNDVLQKNESSNQEQIMTRPLYSEHHDL